MLVTENDGACHKRQALYVAAFQIDWLKKDFVTEYGAPIYIEISDHWCHIPVQKNLRLLPIIPQPDTQKNISRSTRYSTALDGRQNPTGISVPDDR